jgi:energy-coupling factor transporter transmembrane protein EcfT
MEEDLLFSNEEIINTYSPKFMSFIVDYLPYIYLTLSGLLFYIDDEYSIQFFNLFYSFPSPIKENIKFIAFIILLIIPSIIYGLFKISYKIVFLYIIIIISGIYFQIKNYPTIYMISILILFGLSGIFYTDYNRKQFKYHITNFRLVLEQKGIRYRKRELLYDKIQDLSVQQSVLGKIFNYGNIIPTSSSGIGTGYDSSSMNAGAGLTGLSALSFGILVGGEKGVVGFRARPNNCLYGIPNPRRNITLVSKMMFERNEVTKLEEIKDIMKDIRDRDHLI